MLNVSTISFVYDQLEDRIRMICDVSSEERIDLWLTRNMVINWLNISEQLLTKISKWSDHVSEEAMADVMKMEHEDNLEKTSEQVSQVDDVSLNQVTPLLMSKIDISTTNESFYIEFFAGEAVASITFNEDMMHRLMNLLVACLEKTNWAIHSELFSQSSLSADSPPRVLQ